jgi:hypothetical protein
MNDTKLKITQAVLLQLPQSNQTIESIVNEWWLTKSNEGLRLTVIGDTHFRLAQIEYFDLPLEIKQANWHKFILDCSKKIKSPYYIGVNKGEDKKKEAFIRIYDSKIAMLTTLYGSIQEYLESVKGR